MEDSRTPKISVTRKRGASISTIDANLHGVYDQIGGSAANPMKAEATQDVICLCTPAPKIPRPRNGEFVTLSHCLYLNVSVYPSSHSPWQTGRAGHHIIAFWSFGIAVS